MKKEATFQDLTPDPVGVILGTNFLRFNAPKFAMNGLVKLQDGVLELLAVVSDKPSRGNFRAFIHACQREFKEIKVWHIENPLLESALSRYGFVATQKFDAGELIPGMIWST